MTWIITAAYYLGWSLIILIGVEIYGRALKIVGQLKFFVKVPSAMVIYILFSVIIVSPLLLGFDLLDPADAFRGSTLYHAFYLSCYILSLVPGFCYFKSVHLKPLREAGFFGGKEN